jgi:uncharacterized membrane protein
MPSPTNALLSLTTESAALDQAGLPIVLGALAVFFVVAWVGVVLLVAIVVVIVGAVRKHKRKQQAQQQPPAGPPPGLS